LGVTAKDDLDHTLRKLCTLSNDEDEDAENTLLITLVSPIKLDDITQKLEAVSAISQE
jgi:hypothetical protein